MDDVALRVQEDVAIVPGRGGGGGVGVGGGGGGGGGALSSDCLKRAHYYCWTQYTYRVHSHRAYVQEGNTHSTLMYAHMRTHTHTHTHSPAVSLHTCP